MSVAILLVEDNEFVQRMYGRFFVEAGFQVTTASDGIAAIDLAAKSAPHIIVMDVMMPNMNGMEALRQLKSDPRTTNIPIIMLSAYDDSTLMKQALDLGASRYLVKSSLEPSEIITIINEVLASTNPANTAEPAA